MKRKKKEQGNLPEVLNCLSAGGVHNNEIDRLFLKMIAEDMKKKQKNV
jgi:hypothetical protein